jgi:hypothetical protein
MDRRTGMRACSSHASQSTMDGAAVDHYGRRPRQFCRPHNSLCPVCDSGLQFALICECASSVDRGSEGSCGMRFAPDGLMRGDPLPIEPNHGAIVTFSRNPPPQPEDLAETPVQMELITAHNVVPPDPHHPPRERLMKIRQEMNPMRLAWSSPLESTCCERIFRAGRDHGGSMGFAWRFGQSGNVWRDAERRKRR